MKSTFVKLALEAVTPQSLASRMEVLESPPDPGPFGFSEVAGIKAAADDDGIGEVASGELCTAEIEICEVQVAPLSGAEVRDGVASVESPTARTAEEKIQRGLARRSNQVSWRNGRSCSESVP